MGEPLSHKKAISFLRVEKIRRKVNFKHPLRRTMKLQEQYNSEK